MAQSENVANMDDIDISIEENQEERIPSSKSKDVSLIVEVEGSPNKHTEYIETYYPAIKVVQVYEKIFTGLALKAHPDKLQPIGQLEFVKNIHPVKTYQLSPELKETMVRIKQESLENNTSYTGKGVKIAVIDTGIDYNKNNETSSMSCG